MASVADRLIRIARNSLGFGYLHGQMVMARLSGLLDSSSSQTFCAVSVMMAPKTDTSAARVSAKYDEELLRN